MKVHGNFAETWIANNMEYFTPKEFKCKCGECQLAFETQLGEKLDELRGQFGKPLIVNSGYRCIEYNKTVDGAAKDSQHTHGTAADITCKDFTKEDKEKIIQLARKLGFKGIGIHYNSFVHVDMRTGPKVEF